MIPGLSASTAYARGNVNLLGIPLADLDHSKSRRDHMPKGEPLGALSIRCGFGMDCAPLARCASLLRAGL